MGRRRLITKKSGLPKLLRWIHALRSGQDVLNMVMVYRPPRDPGSDADAGNYLSRVEGNVVIFGDFNMPGIDW